MTPNEIHVHYPQIVEQKLGIPPDYQLKAINSSNFLQANWHKNKLVVLSKVVKLTKSTNVLNLGMGSGNYEFAHFDKVKSITCVDYNDQAIEFVKQRADNLGIKNLTLYHKDIRQLSELSFPYKFDLVLLIDVIEHISTAEAPLVLNAIKKLLTPTGKVVVITPNYKSGWQIIEKVLDQFTIVPKFGNEQHLAKYHRDNLNSLFNKCGFEATSFCSFNLISFAVPPVGLSQLVCKLETELPFALGNLICGVYKLDKIV